VVDRPLRVAGVDGEDRDRSMTGNAHWLWKLARAERMRYAVAIVALAIGTLLLYVPPLLVGATIDFVLGNRAQDVPAPARLAIETIGGREFVAGHLWIAGLAIVVVTSIGGAFMYLKSRFAAIACENIARQLRQTLYDHLQHLPLRWHDTHQTGDVVQRCSTDVETVRNFYSNQVVEIVRASVLLLTAIPILLWLDWVMALVAVSVLPVIVIFAIVFFARVQHAFKAMDEADGAMTTVLQENLSGVRVVRAFAREQFEIDKFARKNHGHRDLHWKLFRIMAVYWSSSDFLCFTQLTLVLIVGALRVAGGDMTVGTLVAFLSYVNIYLWPVRMMGRILTETGKAMVAIGRIREVLDAPLEAPPADPLPLPPQVKGRVEFRDVRFRHRDADVLHGISFAIEPGRTLALLGPSGSGKSTIASLLLKLHDPTAGTITLDGLDLSRLGRKDVRSVVSSVMQEPFLYSKTVRDNIRLGRPAAGDEEIIRVAEMARIHESIERFEKSYDTVVGERGVTLSGGQRQRVAIARALLKDAPVLILDDALSAVDTQTESHILEALRRRRGHHTTLLIAHRLSTLQHADEILVLEHGRVVQRGTHEQLMNVEGMYRRLWQIQTALEEDLQSEIDRPASLAPAAG
jgi:ATP-binding cassette subfamily B protein